jgi:hypothetical protein
VFSLKKGRSTKKTDMSLGLLILKHFYKKSDRELVRDFNLNNSYTHFRGLRCKQAGEKGNRSFNVNQDKEKTGT